MREQEIKEVAMNPTEFGKAIEQGGQAGVLAGFEFEVLVPEATIDSLEKKNVDVKKSMTPEQVSEMLVKNDFFERDVDDIPLNLFFEAFKPKSPDIGKKVQEGASTLMDPERNLQSVKELFNRLPVNTRSRYVPEALRRFKERFGNRLRSMSQYEKEFRFAIMLASLIINSSRSHEASNTGYHISRLARTGIGYGVSYKDIFRKGGIGKASNNPYEFFDFTEEGVRAMLKKVDMEYLLDDEYDDDDYDDHGNYSRAAKVISPILQQTMGAKVNIFYEYHQDAKNLKDWYIEPDGSLEPNRNDGSAEIVSPPLPAVQAVDALKKFFAMAEQLKLYTNGSTGLHINVSIPEKIDVLKLAVFLGDTYVAKQFGREDNEYVDLVMKSLQNKVPQANTGRYSDTGPVLKTKEIPAEKNPVFNHPGIETIKYRKKALAQLAKDATGFHTASISYNGKYVSFRHAGGNYLAEFNKIYATVGRFIRAMIIASDPTLYRNEYLTKLMKLYQPAASAPTAPPTSITNELMKNGVPVEQIHVYPLNAARLNNAFSAYLNAMKIPQPYPMDSEFAIKAVPVTPAGKRLLASSNANLRRNAPALERLRTLEVYPLTTTALKFLTKLKTSETEEYMLAPARSFSNRIYFYAVKKRLPLSNPAGREVVKTIARNIKK